MNRDLEKALDDLTRSLCDLMPQAVSLETAYCAASDRYSADPETEALIYGVGKVFGNMALRIGEALAAAEDIGDKLREVEVFEKQGSVVVKS